MRLHRHVGAHLQGCARRPRRLHLRRDRARPGPARRRRHRPAAPVARQRLQRAGADPLGARHPGRPHQGPRHRRRRLPAEALQLRGAARARALAGPPAVVREAGGARASRDSRGLVEPHGPGKRRPHRPHQPRIRAARDLHAEPGTHPHAHPHFREDLGLALRRRHQPPRRVHEPAARQARDFAGQGAVQDRARRGLPAAVKSIRARLTFWYAFAATATLACLFIAGHYMLQNHLIRQLDLLNETQFRQLRTALGPNYQSLTPAVINERIRDTTESASTPFYIDMHGPMTNRFFKSNNLHGQSIPDIPGERAYSAEVPGIGLLRISEFLLPPFEVTVATPVAPVDDVMAGYVKVSAALIIVMLLASIGLGYGLSQIVLRPVRTIRDTANRIRSDNLKERIPVDAVKDEISELARLLNQMFDRLETAFDQIRRFTADASHELNTPLSLVRPHVERILVTGHLDDRENESLHVQLEELARVNQIIDEPLFLSP